MKTKGYPLYVTAYLNILLTASTLLKTGLRFLFWKIFLVGTHIHGRLCKHVPLFWSLLYLYEYTMGLFYTFFQGSGRLIHEHFSTLTRYQYHKQQFVFRECGLMVLNYIEFFLSCYGSGRQVVIHYHHQPWFSPNVR